VATPTTITTERRPWPSTELAFSISVIPPITAFNAAVAATLALRIRHRDFHVDDWVLVEGLAVHLLDGPLACLHISVVYEHEVPCTLFDVCDLAEAPENPMNVFIRHRALVPWTPLWDPCLHQYGSQMKMLAIVH